jgi:hypothetical protein
MKITPAAAGHLLAQRTNLQPALAELYLASCRLDAERIAGVIAAPPKTAVDIGGGLGGVSACLSRVWPECEFIVVDRNGCEGRKIGYGDNFGKYNQLAETGQFLTSAGVRHRLVDADCEPLPGKADLVFSVLSWGFHYPVATYLAWAGQVAAQLVIDCRAGLPGTRTELYSAYPHVRLFDAYLKHEWYICSR